MPKTDKALYDTLQRAIWRSCLFLCIIFSLAWLSSRSRGKQKVNDY